MDDRSSRAKNKSVWRLAAGVMQSTRRIAMSGMLGTLPGRVGDTNCSTRNNHFTQSIPNFMFKGILLVIGHAS